MRSGCDDGPFTMFPPGPEKWLWHLLLVLIHIFGSFNSLFFGLANVILERDWVVVIADDDEVYLRDITAYLKQIDLCCDLVGPPLVSALQFFSYDIMALVLR